MSKNVYESSQDCKDTQTVVGLMSGTSLDGIDAVLTEITGYGFDTKVREREFICVPIEPAIREHILRVAQGDFGGSREIADLSFLLGKLFADAVLQLCHKAQIAPNDIDIVGTHGQTIWHAPDPHDYLGQRITSTLQIGEPSFINEVTTAVVVSDFRVRDMAAGGMGAPLVPYTEYLLYKSDTETIALQNIGGIGNVTIIPPCSDDSGLGLGLDNVTAFDTGPGNMIIDALIGYITNGRQSYDRDGGMAAAGCVNAQLLAMLLDDPYYTSGLPKTTGRERYNDGFIQNIIAFARQHSIADSDMVATATFFTAKTIELALTNKTIVPVAPSRLIIGGGGASNPTLMGYIRDCLPEIVVAKNEDLGYNSNSKEAVAFAILANEAVHGHFNNATGATGAERYVIMGKISR